MVVGVSDAKLFVLFGLAPIVYKALHKSGGGFVLLDAGRCQILFGAYRIWI